MINGVFVCSEVKICDFDWLFSFDSYLLNVSSNFTQMGTIESLRPGLSDCEKMISPALENSKVFFIYHI